MIKLARKDGVWYTTVTILDNPVTVPFINSRDAIHWSYAFVYGEYCKGVSVWRLK